jgi:hypothetical protein
MAMLIQIDGVTRITASRISGNGREYSLAIFITNDDDEVIQLELTAEHKVVLTALNPTDQPII